MKAYGIPRNDDVANPDKADIKYYGLSTEDRCSKADRGKNKARRFFKKAERKNADKNIIAELNTDE